MGRTKVRLFQALEDSGPNTPNDLTKHFVAETFLAYGRHEIAFSLALGESTPHSILDIGLDTPSEAFHLHRAGVAVQARPLVLLMGGKTVVRITKEVLCFLG